ncbi:MAG: hypothetical protein HIU81_11715, partial [Acidobacteria bacterium]|nr:hypothetical protein [Acidobacteriota bacterium]
ALRLWSGCLIHEVALGSYDVATIAGIRLSTPLRTAVDLALFENHPAGMDALTRLSRAESLKCPPATITAALKAQGRMPHKLEAIKRVDSLSSRPEPRPC